MPASEKNEDPAVKWPMYIAAHISASLVGIMFGTGAFNGVLGGFLYVAQETDIYDDLSGLNWAMTQFLAIGGAFMVAVVVMLHVRQQVLALTIKKNAD